MKLAAVERIAKVAGVGVAGLALVFSLYQYFNNKAEERVHESMRLVETYNSEELQKTRIIIDSFWRREYPKYRQPSDTELSTVADRERQRKRWSEFVNETVKKGNLDQHLSRLIDFFDRSAICAQTGPCDPATTRNFLGGYAPDFYQFHKPYIERLRATGYPEFAVQMQKFYVNAN